MSTLTGLLYTARDALTAQSYGLSVTGQNVANAATPAYARREVVLQTRAGGDGGVEVLGVRQALDRFTEARLLDATSLGAAASERDSQLASVEALFNDLSDTGLGGDLSALFASFETLSVRPQDPVVRAQVLETADAFASRASDVGEQLAVKHEQLLLQAQAVAGEINGLAQQISTLNREIRLSEDSGGDAANLIDQRNRQLLELSKLVDIRPVQGADGDLMIQAAGTTLVEGDIARWFEIGVDATGGMTLLARPENGGSAVDVTAHLAGGKLAGLRDARDGEVAGVIALLDRFVFDVSSAVNAQHALGVGSDGTGGNRLFDCSATVSGAARSLRVSADVAGHPERIAAAGDPSSLPAGAENALLLATLAAMPVASGGTRTPGDAYADIVGQVGLRKSAAASTMELRTAILQQSQLFRESTSGVSLDEEMVALTRYQQAYQAASKVLSTVDELLAELIQRVG